MKPHDVALFVYVLLRAFTGSYIPAYILFLEPTLEMGVLRSTGRTSADVATGRGVFNGLPVNEG